MIESSSSIAASAEEYNIAIEREVWIGEQEAAGFVVVFPADDELQIDLDSDLHRLLYERNLPHFSRIILELCEGKGKPEITRGYSKSGPPNLHVTVKLPFAVDPAIRIALQACLGSDPLRELLSLSRLLRGDRHPTLFVEKKE